MSYLLKEGNAVSDKERKAFATALPQRAAAAGSPGTWRFP